MQQDDRLILDYEKPDMTGDEVAAPSAPPFRCGHSGLSSAKDRRDAVKRARAAEARRYISPKDTSWESVVAFVCFGIVILCVIGAFTIRALGGAA